MNPTADDVARAIVAAAKATGASPEAVACGDLDPSMKGGVPRGDNPFAISRARVYACYALHKLFPDAVKSAIARGCGVRKDTSCSFFSAVDQRGGITQKWCDAAAFDRVLGAVLGGRVRESVKVTAEKTGKTLPAAKRAVAPYRPPVGTAAAILADDDDDGPVFDVGGLGQGFKRRDPQSRVSKREMEADLRAAIERTAAMQPKE